VTHDRLSFVKECVARLRSQTYAADILIVDNASTDGTAAWLAEQADVAYIRQTNVGGAGGFYTALKAGYWLGYDLIWCMDDDALPEDTCLEELVTAIDQVRRNGGRPGWACSAISWVDGSPARQNQPLLVPPTETLANTNDLTIAPARSCSFVSVCISRDAIAEVGLPLREMFIWFDDVEYTRRIVEAGFGGVLARRSLATHKTPTNIATDLAGLDRASSWKYRYKFRNTATLMRTISKGSLADFAYLFTQSVWRTTLGLIRANKSIWLPYAWYWLTAGLFFRPKVDPAGLPWERRLASPS
jgi:rhamnopyranosyl-N-acetylglucosaminyl-diphospho-decaprenol beta-1,3/1,4-galactofuranosyltransferase